MERLGRDRLGTGLRPKMCSRADGVRFNHNHIRVCSGVYRFRIDLLALAAHSQAADSLAVGIARAEVFDVLGISIPVVAGCSFRRAGLPGRSKPQISNFHKAEDLVYLSATGTPEIRP
jgi:hypothetical protein